LVLVKLSTKVFSTFGLQLSKKSSKYCKISAVSSQFCKIVEQKLFLINVILFQDCRFFGVSKTQILWKKVFFKNSIMAVLTVTFFISWFWQNLWNKLCPIFPFKNDMNCVGINYINYILCHVTPYFLFRFLSIVVKTAFSIHDFSSSAISSPCLRLSHENKGVSPAPLNIHTPSIPHAKFNACI
jgi:hypothetical protein